jgi:ribonuclease P protein component
MRSAGISIKKTKTSGSSRLFFVMSKKNIKTAVARNRIKRRIRVILQKFLQEPGFVYTVVVRKEAEKASFSDLKSEILKN